MYSNSHDINDAETGNDNSPNISSEFENTTGVVLSAFNLSIHDDKSRKLSVKSPFQGIKVFEQR